jgi:glucose-1-phosphate thymidylyltransferase
MSEQNRKGIILAGGSGTRLWPLTAAVSKQLLPIWDKPTIFYPLSTLMTAGIREFLVISSNRDLPQFRELLGDGSRFGITINYASQKRPNGIAEALLIAEDFIDNHPSALILGDNIFHGSEIKKIVQVASESQQTSVIACPVADPERYGVVSFDTDGLAQQIIEKPQQPQSKYAVTGLYFYDSTASERAKTLKPSGRGELEITDLNNSYLSDQLLRVHCLTEDVTWLDTGTNYSFLQASQIVETIQNRQGLLIGSPELTALENGWITQLDIENVVSKYPNSSYSVALIEACKQYQLKI